MAVVIIALFFVPNGTTSDAKYVNDQEMRDQLQDASDKLLLATDTQQRQEAAREIRSIQAQLDPNKSIAASETTTEALATLRIVLIVIILLIGIKLLLLAFNQIRLQSAPGN
jgi:CHASE3 domain sensor protein